MDPVSDTYQDEQGRELWAEGNSQGKRPHSLAKRPNGAAPLFDQERAGQLNRQRRLQRIAAAERGLIEAAAEELDVDPATLTFEDAYQLISKMQGRKAIKGHTAAAKFAAQATDILPEVSKPTEIQQQTN